MKAENAERAELCLYDGNNNAWCQDNELSWFHWGWDGDQESRSVIVLRRGW